MCNENKPKQKTLADFVEELQSLIKMSPLEYLIQSNKNYVAKKENKLTVNNS